MKALLVVALAFGLASCGQARPPDCDTALRQLNQCMAQHAGKTEREMLLACLPFSAPERIEGTWATDFEFNEFFEGKRVAPDEVWQYRGRSIYLSADTPLRKFASGPSQAVISYIVFEGRRDLCNLPDAGTIVADRVISDSLVEARASKWNAAP